jgi:nicotinamidase-related amidase
MTATRSPVHAKRALLLVDVFSDFRFEDGPGLADALVRTAPAIASLITTCRKRGEPVIYCNDNFQRWHDSWRGVLAYTGREGVPASLHLLDLLYPANGDVVLLKSRHSAFYHTQLVPLLEHLGTKELCIAGAATDACVLCTAIDAHVRGYRVTIARDAVASATKERQARALLQMGDSLGLRLERADTWLSAETA